jgi:hypothetical protein
VSNKIIKMRKQVKLSGRIINEVVTTNASEVTGYDKVV